MSKFNMYVDKKGPDDCWLWTGIQYRGPRGGYGRLLSRGFEIPAHRLAFMLFYNIEIPKSLVCCHSCDEPLCVNALHVMMGPQKLNLKDSINKDRRSYKHKREIRFAAARERSLGATVKSIVEKYSMSPGAFYHHMRSKEIVDKFGLLVPELKSSPKKKKK